MGKILRTTSHWQIFIALTIILSGSIYFELRSIIAGLWIGWTIKKGIEGTRFIPIQITTIIVSFILAVLLPKWTGFYLINP